MERTNKIRLGRGLGALLPESTLKENFRYVSPFAIKPNPYQVREDENVDDLLPSVKEHGIIQPILVRQQGEDLVLIAGSRRLKASKLAGLDKIPAYILSIDDEKALLLTLVENLKREDLNPVEIAEGYRRLIEEFGLTHEKVGEIFGKDRSTITNSLRLLKLSKKVQELIKKKLLQEGHARLLIGLSEEEQIEIAEEIVKKKLSVYETEILIKKRRGNKLKEKTTIIKAKSKFLDADVYIHNGKRGGRILIKYKSHTELERLLNLLQIGGKL